MAVWYSDGNHYIWNREADMAIYCEFTDQKLADLLRSGDHAAFTEIYDRYSGLLYVYAYKLTAEADAAKDMLQELFISLWDKKEDMIVSLSLKSYLYSGIRYKFLKQVAHQKVRKSYADQFLQSMEIGLNSTENYISEKDFMTSVEKLVLALPPKMARVFLLSKLHFQTNAEIAEELDISEKTVQNLLSMGIKRILPKVKRSIMAVILIS